MNCFIRETRFSSDWKRTAGSKAREDINEIAENMGFHPLEVAYDEKLRGSRGVLAALCKLSRSWARVLARIGKGDVVLIQFPLYHRPVFVARHMRKVHSRGGRIILLIHDLDILRSHQNTAIKRIIGLRTKVHELAVLRSGDALIAHNRRMIEAMGSLGLPNSKTISLGIFDYLVHDDFPYPNRNKEDPIIIAGNLNRGKAGYAYGLPGNIRFNLYGVGYDCAEQESVRYFGAYDPEELIERLEGSFGLVWDGSFSDTCEGSETGEYLTINNPHKTSLYLAAGIPVIVWERAAIAEFVKENHIGLTVSRIGEIPEKISKISRSEYTGMTENSRAIAVRLRTGEYAKKAIRAAIILSQSS